MSDEDTTYQVALPGRFGPAYHHAFAAMGADHVATCTVFRLSGAEDVDIPDVAAMLKRRGLVILSIRRVTRSATRPSRPSSPTGDDRRRPRRQRDAP